MQQAVEIPTSISADEADVSGVVRAHGTGPAALLMFRRDAARLVAGEQLRRRAPSRFLLEADIGERYWHRARFTQTGDHLARAWPELSTACNGFRLCISKL